jgi:hypothetical protein
MFIGESFTGIGHEGRGWTARRSGSTRPVEDRITDNG